MQSAPAQHRNELGEAHVSKQNSVVCQWGLWVRRDFHELNRERSCQSNAPADSPVRTSRSSASE
jgi:hypothetical protein